MRNLIIATVAVAFAGVGLLALALTRRGSGIADERPEGILPREPRELLQLRARLRRRDDLRTVPRAVRTVP